jgi:glycosyltransferase involved in cell wall biosynthesis
MISWIKVLEGISCRTADHIVAVSEVDKDFLIEMYRIPEEKISIIQHCVDHEVFKFKEKGRSTVREKFHLNDSLVFSFVGKLDYIPNIRAVSFIAEKIYPEVIKKYPNSKFLIVGQNAEKFEHYQNKNIIFTGFVDSRQTVSPNLADFISASDVILVPLDSGSGTRLKILEAAACSRPIISTKIGAEGQIFIHNKEIILAELQDGEFIDAILELVANKEKLCQLGNKARLKVLEKYTWSKEIAKFEDIYERLLN